MRERVSVPALLQFLGVEAARAVLAELGPAERVFVALEAVEAPEVAPSEQGRTVARFSLYLTARELASRGGVARAREVLEARLEPSVVDEVLDGLAAAADDGPPCASGPALEALVGRPASVVARVLVWLPAADVAWILASAGDRAGELAMHLAALGQAGHLASAVASMEPSLRRSVLEAVAADDPVLALRLRMASVDVASLLDALGDDDLVRVVAAATVEDLAVLLMTAGNGLRRRVLQAASGERRRLLRTMLLRPAPVRLQAMEASAGRVLQALTGPRSERFGHPRSSSAESVGVAAWS